MRFFVNIQFSEIDNSMEMVDNEVMDNEPGDSEISDENAHENEGDLGGD